jgi:hypothetical protein
MISLNRGAGIVLAQALEGKFIRQLWRTSKIASGEKCNASQPAGKA